MILAWICLSWGKFEHVLRRKEALSGRKWGGERRRFGGGDGDGAVMVGLMGIHRFLSLSLSPRLIDRVWMVMKQEKRLGRELRRFSENIYSKKFYKY